MLEPNHRSLYTTALTPPGFLFDEAIATTYSLDLTTLLTVPLHLAMRARGDDQRLLTDAVALLEGLRRVIDKLTVYCEAGRTEVPQATHLLYGLLERSIVEVSATLGGAFHPKLWVLRYVDPTGRDAPVLRLLILSRNLTADRSWDVSLQLEGRPGPRNHAASGSLAELVAALPDLAVTKPSDARRAQAERLSSEVARTAWELPDGFDDVVFHVFGLKRRKWDWPGAYEVAVVSPFCSDRALSAFANSGQALALVSRAESLDALSSETRSRFQRCLVLQDAASGEETDPDAPTVGGDTFGLHAKVFVARRGWTTHVYVGSANATDAAFATNVEVLAELVGKKSRLGGVEALLGADGLEDVLVDYRPPAEPPTIDRAQRAAEDALEEARRRLARAGLRLICRKSGDRWELRLVVPEPVAMPGISRATCWPVSLSEEHGAPIAVPIITGDVVLGAFSVESLTGLTAFALTVDEPACALRFTLNLPVSDLPAERDASVLRLVIRNQDGFLRYLMLLLGDGAVEAAPPPPGDGAGGAFGKGQGFDGLALLEELTRTYCRTPERLDDVESVIRRLGEERDTRDVVPPEFMAVWKAFRSARGGRR